MLLFRVPGATFSTSGVPFLVFECFVLRSLFLSATTIDQSNPLYIQAESFFKKMWVCLFTCVAVRAIHLKLIKDMTTEQFLLGLRCFIARRGKPKQTIRDDVLQLKVTGTAVDKA